MRRSWKINPIVIVALALCALAAPGCVQFRMPRIDPTGEYVFVEPPITVAPPVHDVPEEQSPWDDKAVRLTPKTTVAPVGSEVVLMAAVCGSDGYLQTNRRLEWSLSPGGVGHFIDVGRGRLVDLMVGDFTRPRKVDTTFVIGSTSRKPLRITRGTPTPDDDVSVRRGEGFVTVTSPVEGSSHVSVFAPEVYPWDARTRSATIHWVDAQWRFPPPSINRSGTPHRLTTTVTRHSDQSPCVGWLVRYEIVDGPPAGFAPDGVTALEVPTDAAGQATLEMFQTQPGPGTNQIAIQVIRPAALGGLGGKRLVVGRGGTTKTWTSRVNGKKAMSRNALTICSRTIHGISVR